MSATHTPWADTPRADTPLADTPPGQTHSLLPSACWDTPTLPPQCMLGYGQQAGSTHTSHWNAFLLPPANKVWGKVIFSEACVKNSVHRGRGVVSQHALKVVSQHALHVVSQHALHGGSPGPHPGGVYPSMH